jgi:hypothetical protein
VPGDEAQCGEVERITADARPDPAGRPRAREDAGAVRELAQAHESDHTPVPAADHAPKRTRRDELGGAEADAEPPQKAGE